jgi:hypothetical protein
MPIVVRNHRNGAICVHPLMSFDMMNAAGSGVLLQGVILASRAQGIGDRPARWNGRRQVWHQR